MKSRELNSSGKKLHTVDYTEYLTHKNISSSYGTTMDCLQSRQSILNPQSLFRNVTKI